ncbi:LacI family DNA-binding transcriptional regulator [Salinicoccus roseus]|uniref:LacI family DNA-binding transcriptional regulator n=1 Tax=Salinicoccus roseus TaxID=45670 RepID=UPI000F5101FC|nr:LacI family DNA-binding transcriptional regulator [Salinicoccus roseus]RPE52879.1 LacI family transcriptional regulator [Salinicoccus roseus]GGA72641.1 putative HTH-type transcriptional regulator MsmR [Salinicoccus roseus]
MVRIKDIADRAKVSSSTVSRVLNQDETLSVADETRMRIIQIAKEMDYKTVQTRRSKQSQKGDTPRIGIMLCQSLDEELDDPYFLSIRHGIENKCNELGLFNSELFRYHHFNPDKMNREEMDALIIVGKVDDEEIARLNIDESKIVYIDYSPDVMKYDSVVVELTKATDLLLDHLFGLGYQQIGYIGGVQEKHSKEGNIAFVDDRQTTFENRMKQAGLYDEEYVYIGKFTMTEGYRLMKMALEKGKLPEAFIVASDPMAIGALSALQESDLKVPGDVAIVSIDDVEMAKFASTPLTTIQLPAEEMGKIAVKLLLDRFEGREIPLKITVPSKLIIRDSCGSRIRSKQMG